MLMFLVPIAWLACAVPAFAQTPRSTGVDEWFAVLFFAATIFGLAVLVWTAVRKLFIDNKPRDAVVGVAAHVIKARRRWDALLRDARDRADRK